MGITTAFARYAADYGVPPAIIGKMVQTEPGRMAWLTPSDLQPMGVALLPAAAPQAQPLPAAPAQAAPPTQAIPSRRRPNTWCRSVPSRTKLVARHFSPTCSRNIRRCSPTTGPWCRRPTLAQGCLVSAARRADFRQGNRFKAVRPTQGARPPRLPGYGGTLSCPSGTQDGRAGDYFGGEGGDITRANKLSARAALWARN